MSYEIKNGILYHNGKKEFAIGQSYYPSFHEAKYPVPPEGDRTGEMKKDFKLMRDAGFNFIRVAAIGSTYLKDGYVIVDTPFVDDMIQEGTNDDIAISVRLQGYVFNLSDNKNYLMIDNEGNEQDISIWYDFIRTSLNHEGSMHDNYIGTKAVAEHFRDKGVVSYQIYNEPHYPVNHCFDYHHDTVDAYRVWLEEEGYFDNAEDIIPPKTRSEKTPEEWALWRLFSQRNLSRFLKESSEFSKETAPKIPTYTCFTGDQMCHSNALYGVDCFDSMQSMDISGFTCYFAPCASTFYKMLAVFNLSESAGALYGKRAWCIELNAMTQIPPQHFIRQSYAAVGTGVKGIVYYQWRGDYPSFATPNPNSCGFLNYDGTKTKNYENAVNMVKLLQELSDEIVNAEKVRNGIAILISDYAYFLCDAMENDDEITKDQHLVSNSYMANMYHIYKAVIKRGLAVDFVRADHLKDNSLNIAHLFVPRFCRLSDEEKAQVKDFQNSGAKVYDMFDVYGDVEELDIEWDKFHIESEIDDVLDDIGIKAEFSTGERNINVQTLKGDDYYVICITNINASLEPIENIEIKSSHKIKMALMYESGKEKEYLEVFENKIKISKLYDGCFIIVKVQ